MIAILVLGFFLVLAMLLVPIMNGIGSYKVERVENHKLRKPKKLVNDDRLYQAQNVDSNLILRHRLNEKLDAVKSGSASGLQIHFEPSISVKYKPLSLDGDLATENDLDRFIEEQELNDQEEAKKQAAQEAAERRSMQSSQLV